MATVVIYAVGGAGAGDAIGSKGSSPGSNDIGGDAFRSAGGVALSNAGNGGGPGAAGSNGVGTGGAAGNAIDGGGVLQAVNITNNGTINGSTVNTV
jgi:hypothetical protein